MTTLSESAYPTVAPRSIEAACCLPSAIELERERRWLMAEEWDEGRDFAFCYEQARSASWKPREYWCELCVGWYGVPHHAGSLMRVFTESDEAGMPCWDSTLEHDSSGLNGSCSPQKSFYKHMHDSCACLACEVTRMWDAARKGAAA